MKQEFLIRGIGPEGEAKFIPVMGSVYKIDGCYFGIHKAEFGRKADWVVTDLCTGMKVARFALAKEAKESLKGLAQRASQLKAAQQELIEKATQECENEWAKRNTDSNLFYKIFGYEGYD